MKLRLDPQGALTLIFWILLLGSAAAVFQAYLAPDHVIQWLTLVAFCR